MTGDNATEAMMETQWRQIHMKLIMHDLQVRSRKYLEHSREYFARHGGAVGDFVVGNKVCAVGAIKMAIGEEMLGKRLLPGDFCLAGDMYTDLLVDMLSTQARRIYDAWTIVDVNDDLGPEAVLHVFDLCIKELDTEGTS